MKRMRLSNDFQKIGESKRKSAVKRRIAQHIAQRFFAFFTEKYGCKAVFEQKTIKRSLNGSKNQLPGGQGSRGNLPKKPRRVWRRKPPNKMKIIFCRGVYLTENTSQAAACRICVPQARKLCAQQTAKLVGKARKGFFDSINRLPGDQGSRGKTLQYGNRKEILGGISAIGVQSQSA